MSFEQLAPHVWLHLSTLELAPWGEVPSCLRELLALTAKLVGDHQRARASDAR